MNEIHHVGYVPFSVKVKRCIWDVFWVLFFRPFPTKLFWSLRWLLLRMFGAQLDWHSNVYCSVKIWAPWNLKMERGTCLGPNVICYNQGMVWLKEGCIVSQYAYLCTAGHETDKQNTADEGLITSGITLEQNAWVGTRAFIGMGVIVGENAIVGANAGVYKDVERNTIVGGNPAKVLRRRNANATKVRNTNEYDKT